MSEAGEAGGRVQVDRECVSGLIWRDACEQSDRIRRLTDHCVRAYVCKGESLVFWAIRFLCLLLWYCGLMALFVPMCCLRLRTWLDSLCDCFRQPLRRTRRRRYIHIWRRYRGQIHRQMAGCSWVAGPGHNEV